MAITGNARKARSTRKDTQGGKLHAQALCCTYVIKRILVTGAVAVNGSSETTILVCQGHEKVGSAGPNVQSVLLQWLRGSARVGAEISKFREQDFLVPLFK